MYFCHWIIQASLHESSEILGKVLRYTDEIMPLGCIWDQVVCCESIFLHIDVVDVLLNEHHSAALNYSY